MRISSVKHEASFIPFTLSGFTYGLIACFFSEDSKSVFGVDAGGSMHRYTSPIIMLTFSQSYSWEWHALSNEDKGKKGLNEKIGKWWTGKKLNVKMPKTKVTTLQLQYLMAFNR